MKLNLPGRIADNRAFKIRARQCCSGERRLRNRRAREQCVRKIYSTKRRGCVKARVCNLRVFEICAGQIRPLKSDPARGIADKSTFKIRARQCCSGKSHTRYRRARKYGGRKICFAIRGGCAKVHICNLRVFETRFGQLYPLKTDTHGRIADNRVFKIRIRQYCTGKRRLRNRRAREQCFRKIRCQRTSILLNDVSLLVEDGIRGAQGVKTGPNNLRACEICTGQIRSVKSNLSG